MTNSSAIDRTQPGTAVPFAFISLRPHARGALSWSRCVAAQLPGFWAMSWGSGEAPVSADIAGEIQDFLIDAEARGDLVYPGVLLDEGLARAVQQRWGRAQGFRLIMLSVATADLAAVIDAADNAQAGLRRVLDRPLRLPDDARPLGWEAMSFYHGPACSWHCNGLAADRVDLNADGLLTWAAARALCDDITAGRIAAEPGAWFPIHLAELP